MSAPGWTKADDELLRRDCLAFVQDQSSGEWGEELEVSDAAKLFKFVKARVQKARGDQ